MSDFWLAVECIFTNTWKLLTSIDFPGTNMSIAQLLVGMLMAVISLRLLFFVLGIPVTLKASDVIRKAPVDVPKTRPGAVSGYLPKGK